MKPNGIRHNEQGGTLVELMVALAILGLVTAGIFSQLGAATQRITAEQTKVDNFDQARDFVDQFFRDINQIGYPNGRIVTNLTNGKSDARVAVGLVKISANSIWFEGDINGTGVVQSVQYQINGSGNCGLCFQRSAIPKVNGTAPLSQLPPIWGTEVNDLVTPTIFTYFDASGNPITTPLPADINSNGATLALVKTIHISLTIQNNAVMDPKTGQPIQTSFEGEVSLNNCSMAANGINPMSCQ
jgi:type II secretory pathway pseudopilin PulG